MFCHDVVENIPHVMRVYLLFVGDEKIKFRARSFTSVTSAENKDSEKGSNERR